MITDDQTNFVFLSGLLPGRYPAFCSQLTEILKTENIPFAFLRNTRDIWCRDYMPVQLTESEFLQFVYDPDYLKPARYRKLKTDPAKAYPELLNGIKNTDIILDGGNIVRYRDQVLITSKVIDENSRYPQKELMEILRQELQVKRILIIPQLPDDMTGHSDGMVRWINEKNLLVNDFRNYHRKGYFELLKKSIEAYDLHLTLLPWDAWKNDTSLDDSGDYINFLQVGKVIILPEYGNLSDAMAKSVIHYCFPKTKIYSIDCSEIAKEGGLLNCCTWNINTNIPQHYL